MAGPSVTADGQTITSARSSAVASTTAITTERAMGILVLGALGVLIAIRTGLRGVLK